METYRGSLSRHDRYRLRICTAAVIELGDVSIRMTNFLDPNLSCGQIRYRNIAVGICSMGSGNQFGAVLIAVDTELPTSKILTIFCSFLKAQRAIGRFQFKVRRDRVTGRNGNLNAYLFAAVILVVPDLIQRRGRVRQCCRRTLHASRNRTICCNGQIVSVLAVRNATGACKGESGQDTIGVGNSCGSSGQLDFGCSCCKITSKAGNGIVQLQVTNDGVVGIQKVVCLSIFAHANALGLIKPVCAIQLVGISRISQSLRQLPDNRLSSKSITDIGVVQIPIIGIVNAPAIIPEFGRCAVKQHQGNGHTLICGEAIPYGFTMATATAIEREFAYTCMTTTDTKGFFVLQTVDHVHVVPGGFAILIGIVETLAGSIRAGEIHPVAVTQGCSFLYRPSRRKCADGFQQHIGRLKLVAYKSCLNKDRIQFAIIFISRRLRTFLGLFQLIACIYRRLSDLSLIANVCCIHSRHNG